jgi:hypothetical protein
MNLRPPPRTDNLSEIRRWQEDLYEFLKYPVFHKMDVGDVANDEYSKFSNDGRIRCDKIWHAYGGFEGEGETITAGSGTWHLITNATDDLWTLDEADGVTITDDVLTITNGGDYFGLASLSISGLNTKDFHVRLYNNTQTAVMGRAIGVSTTGANNEVNVALPLYIEADAGDQLQFEISSVDGSDPTVDDGLFIITYLHD